MGLHHVATVGLAVLSLLSLVLFRAIGPPLQPRVLPSLFRVPSFQESQVKPPPPPPARNMSSTKPRSVTRHSFPWPTTLAVGSLWAIKARCPHWGQSSPYSYDVSRELLTFTPGDGLGDVVASILTLGLSEHQERQRDPTLGIYLDLPPIILKTCAVMYVSRTLLLYPSFPLFGSLGFYSLGVALAYASFTPQLPMWGCVGFEAAKSLHDLLQANDTPWWQRPRTRQGALKAILRVTTAALVAQEQGCRRWQRAQRRVMRALPPVRATPVGNGSRRAEEKEDGEETAAVSKIEAVGSSHPWGTCASRHVLPSMKRRPKTRRHGSAATTTTTTIRLGAAVRPSCRPPGPVKGSGSAEKSSLG